MDQRDAVIRDDVRGELSPHVNKLFLVVPRLLFLSSVVYGGILSKKNARFV